MTSAGTARAGHELPRRQPSGAVTNGRRGVAGTPGVVQARRAALRQGIPGVVTTSHPPDAANVPPVRSASRVLRIGCADGLRPPLTRPCRVDLLRYRGMRGGVGDTGTPVCNVTGRAHPATFAPGLERGLTLGDDPLPLLLGRDLRLGRRGHPPGLGHQRHSPNDEVDNLCRSYALATLRRGCVTRSLSTERHRWAPIRGAR